jgi:diguanylate cyclase (GGDEF)-like protein
LELESHCIPARLLLVDDSPTNLRFLAHILHNMGEIFFATDGNSALKIARDKQPDLILLDVEMPGMSGYEVCKQLKLDPLLADASVIFVTSHQSMEHEVQALEVGGVDFISKPLNPPVIRARVRTHITLKQQSDRLRRLANRDGMTGVFNRRALDEILDVEFRRHMRVGAPLGLAMLDVDFFKAYNDCYGHLQGDDCLRHIASTIVSATRRPAESVCRYGGEEFMVVLPNCNAEQTLHYGNWLLEQIHRLALPHQRSELGIVTISVGITSQIPSESNSIQELIQYCDEALYKAKHQGRDRVCVYQKNKPEAAA